MYLIGIKKASFQNHKVGGPRVTMVPQHMAWTLCRSWAWLFKHTWTYTMTTITVAVIIVSVTNWHSTQSWAHVAVAVMCPWQLWCTQSLHSVSVACGTSWKWSEENISIGRNTANKIHAEICLRIVFTTAKVRIIILFRKRLVLNFGKNEETIIGVERVLSILWSSSMKSGGRRNRMPMASILSNS